MSQVSIKSPAYRLAKLWAVLIVAIINILIAPYYTGGDQVHYREIYDGIADLNLLKGYSYYVLHIQSLELLHYLFSWLGAYFGFEKDMYYACISGLLVYYFLGCCEKYGVSVWVALSIVFTNFYFFVLYFSAERLKVAFIFFFISILVSSRSRASLLSALLSVLSHAQMGIVYFSILFANNLNNKFDGRRWKSNLYLLLIVLVIFIVLGEHISQKLVIYSNEVIGRGVVELFRLAVFFALSMYYTDNKKQVIFLFLPLFVLVALIGGDRINMLAYFIFLYFGLKCNGGVNLGVLFTTIFFAFKSILFIVNIVVWSDGFYYE